MVKVKCQDCERCQINWTWDSPDPKRMGYCTGKKDELLVKVNATRECKIFEPKIHNHTGERIGRKTETTEARKND